MVIQPQDHISPRAFWFSALISFVAGIIMTVILISGDTCTFTEFDEDTRAAIAQKEAVITEGQAAVRERDSLRALLR